MKKTIWKVSNVIAISLILSMLLSTTVLAAEVETFEVKWDDIKSEEDKNQSPPIFSISNVLNVRLDKYEYNGEKFEEYDASLPSTVTLLGDSILEFKIYKATVDNNNNCTIDFEQELSMSGKVAIYEPSTEKLINIDISDLDKYSDGGIIPVYLPIAGSYYTLSEPGDYYVFVQHRFAGSLAQAVIRVKDSGKTISTSEPTKTDAANQKIQALPTSSKVLVNGKEVSFEAYNIEGNNYFKLRDVALTVSGTEKQFGVEWDGVKQAINLTSNSVYQTIGGEMAKGDGTTKDGLLNSAPIYKDGVDVQLKAYNINGNNYFKLRDLAQAFNIGVTWDNEAQTIVIDTTRSYSED